MGCSRQEYWSGLPCPPLGDLSDPGIEPECLMSPALGGSFFTTSSNWSYVTEPAVSVREMKSFLPTKDGTWVFTEPACKMVPKFDTARGMG